MSATPATPQSAPSAQSQPLTKNAKKLLKDRTKHFFVELAAGRLLWNVIEENDKRAPGVNRLQVPVPEPAVHRSQLAREDTARRSREAREAAVRGRERMERRQRGSSSASAFSVQQLRQITSRGRRRRSEAQQFPEPRKPNLTQTVRQHQQRGQGIGSVAQEYLSRDNSAANLSVMGQTTERPRSVQKAKSSADLPTSGAAAVVPAGRCDRAAKEGELRATKSATELTVGPSRDSALGSSNQPSFDSVRTGSVGQKKPSVSSGSCTHPHSATFANAEEEEDDEGEDQGLAMALAPAVAL
ncbi:MAG: hypothetical protein LQ338_004884 [Usnochroma carphineum]|nr:MAG: hypothetical protein LQ338_004884 [Usnochroma carphineum]